jgi:ATP-dependent helicase/nuclease subunit B
MPTHFMVAPDAQSAATIRKEFAQRGALGVKVGTFEVLLDLLLELWLLKPLEQEWRKKLSHEALQMHDAFWAKSIKNDEKGVVDELDATLCELLDALPLSADTLPEIAEGAERHVRYYNDLRRLHGRMGHLLPDLQYKAHLWHQNAQLEPLEEVVVYVDDTLQLTPWQKDVVERLQTVAKNSSFLELYNAVFSPKHGTSHKDIAHLQQSLFDPSATSNPLPIERLQWLVARDVLQEVEVFAGMVQNIVKNDDGFDKIGVIIPRDGWYSDFLVQTCATFNIPLSRANQNEEYADLGTQWIFDALQCQDEFAVPMSYASLLCSPIMPYSYSRGQQLARLALDGALSSEKVADLGDESKSIVAIIVSWQNQTTAPQVAEFLEQLYAVYEGLGSGESLRIHKQRFKMQLEALESHVETFPESGFTELANQVQPYALKESTQRDAWLHSIHVVYEDEYMIEEIKHLFVLGFNQSHYPKRREHFGVFSRTHWQGLAAATGIPYNPVEGYLERNRAVFKRQLQCASESVTFLSSALNLQGEWIAVSGSLADMAFCFHGGGGDLDPDKLLVRLEEGKTRPLYVPYVDAPTLQPHRVLEPEDLEFGKDLFALRSDEHGNLRPESPSSFETLMISPLAWFLYRRGLEPKTWGVQELDVATQGIIAHGVFEECFCPENPGYDLNGIEAIIRKQMEKHAPYLRQPHRKLERERLHSEIITAAREFKTLLEHCDATVKKTEEELSGSIDGIPVRGRTDALLEISGVNLVLDYKKSGSSKRKKRMEQGYDHQLFLYKLMLDDDQAMTAYYTLNDATLIVDRAVSCPDKTGINLVEVQNECSIHAEALLKERIGQIREGIIELNTKEDGGSWEKRGVAASYTYERSPLIGLFAKEAGGAE